MVYKYILNFIVFFFGLYIIPVYCLSRSSTACLNRYYRNALSGNRKKIIGKLAEAVPIDEHSHGILVRFECPKDYHFKRKWRNFHQQTVLINCFLNIMSAPSLWPICRGPYENVTCSNEYIYSNTTGGKKWLRESKNLLHAEYYPIRNTYPYKKKLTFQCPPGYTFHNALGLVIVQTICKKDGGWKKEWPLCKGNTCSELHVVNGKVKDNNQRYDPGVVLHITCESGYFLWGSDTATCTKHLLWSGNTGECITMPVFRKKCEHEGKSLEVSEKGGNKTLSCSSRGAVSLSEPKSSFRFELAIGIGIPSCFAIVVFTIFAILYVRHQRKVHFRRQANIRAVYNGRETIQLILPTYDEAMQNKPTTPPPTFEETFQLCGDEALQSYSTYRPNGDHLLPNDRPPSYTATCS